MSDQSQTSHQHPAIYGVWPWLAAGLSGLLLALCFAPWNCGWLSWIALTPLICAVWFSAPARGGGWRRRALLGYAAGLIFFTTTFFWLGALATLFEEPWLHGLPLLLALYLALYFALWAWFIGALIDQAGIAANHRAIGSAPAAASSRETVRWHAGRAFLHSGQNLLTAALGASAWITLEWIRGWLFSGFGWNGLGVALRDNLAIIQIVDITGVAGLSFLAAFCNLMLVIVLRRMSAEFGPLLFRRVRWEFSFSVALVVVVFAYGVRTLVRARPLPGTALRIAAVQPNIPQNEKFSSASEDRVFERLADLTTLAASAQPDLLIWPEAAMPRGMFADEVNYRFVLDQAARGDFGFLLGTIDSEPGGEAFNVAALLTNHGRTMQPYRKVHLVPFGEYLPFRNSFPLFAMVAGELVPGDFAAGTEFTVMELARPPIRVSALICFEDTLGDLTRRFVKRGTQLLINLTNDGWFLKTCAAEQHVANALFRAVENRRPLIRCANTGVTRAIDPYGRVDRWLPPFERGFVTREIAIPPGQTATFYTRHGDWLPLICAIGSAVWLVVRIRRRKTA